MSKNNNDVQNADKSVSFIAENVIIEGSITSNTGIVEILGNIKGDCMIENLTIREVGFVKGKITGNIVKIKGTVEGNIEAKVLRIFSTGKILGDISYDILSIEDGAEIHGLLKKNTISENANSTSSIINNKKKEDKK